MQYTDPDRRPAEFLAVQQRYGVVAGKSSLDFGRLDAEAADLDLLIDPPKKFNVTIGAKTPSISRAI